MRTLRTYRGRRHLAGNRYPNLYRGAAGTRISNIVARLEAAGRSGLVFPNAQGPPVAASRNTIVTSER